MKFIKTGILTSLACLLISFHINASAEPCSRPEIWMDIYTGDTVTLDYVINDLSSVQVVYLGEIHTIDRHHRLQELIVEELIKKGKKIILGLEQMEAFNQETLDKFNNNTINFEKLAELTNWKERWSNYKDYQSIIEKVNKKGGIIKALNARDEIIKKIGKEGLGGLTKDERKKLPQNVDFSNRLQERLLNMILKVHSMMDPENLGTVIQAQISIDEKMADELYKIITVNKNENAIVVVLGGMMHFAYRLGVPQRLERRIKDIKDRIILFSESGDLELSRHDLAIARDIEITHQDLRFLNVPIADYINITPQKNVR